MLNCLVEVPAWGIKAPLAFVLREMGKAVYVHCQPDEIGKDKYSTVNKANVGRIYSKGARIYRLLYF